MKYNSILHLSRYFLSSLLGSENTHVRRHFVRHVASSRKAGHFASSTNDFLLV